MLYAVRVRNVLKCVPSSRGGSLFSTLAAHFLLPSAHFAAEFVLLHHSFAAP